MNATSENGDRSGATDYSVWCDSLETVTVTAPETFPVGDLDYCFVQWTGDGDPYGQDVRVNMDGGKVVTARYAICQRVLRIRSETVLGESITGVPIAGAWPGDTPYDAVCDDEEVVNLAAPLNLVLDTTRYRFVRWVIDGSDQEDGQTELSVRMSTEHAVTAVYKEVLPQVIIKGPADRGEQPSPGGGGTFSVDVYLREVYDLAGMQAALKFLDPNSNDASFRISTMGGNPAFGGQAIQFNDALWPSISPLYTDDRTTFGFVGLDGNMDIAEDTKVFSVTYEYGPSALGEYELVTDSLITELAGGDRTAIPFDLVAGHVSICTSHVLSVSAEDIHGAGIPGVPIDGTPTPYERQLCEGESVSLEAPADHAAGEVLYEFVRWILDGEQQPEGQVSVTVQMDGPHSVTAQYVRLHTLTVKSAPFSGVSVTGDKPGTTPYSKYCRDGETVSLLAAPSMTYNDKKFFFLYWFVNGSPRDRYLNPMSEEVTRDTEAVAVYDVTIQGDANSDCLVNILDLIKVRNELGKRCSTSP